MSEHDFDKQINDAFYGTGKPITTEAMLFQQTFNRVAKGTPFSCPIAWVQDGRIVANIRKQETGSVVEALRGCTLQADYEAQARWMIADFNVIHASIPAAKPRNKGSDDETA